MDIMELAFREDLVDSYRRDKNPKPLADAIRNNELHIFSPRMRAFIADIVEGKEKLPNRKDPKNELRNTEIILKIHCYSGAGIAIKTSEDTESNNCCLMVAEEYGMHQDHIYKKIWITRVGLERKFSFLQKVSYQKSIGRLVLEYKGRKPKSLEEFNAVYDVVANLPCTEYDELLKQAEDRLKEENYIKEKLKFIRAIKKYAKEKGGKLSSKNMKKFFVKLEKSYGKYTFDDGGVVGNIPINIEVMNCIKNEEEITDGEK